MGEWIGGGTGQIGKMREVGKRLGDGEEEVE